MTAAKDAVRAPVTAAGLWGSAAPIAAALVAARLGRPLLLITAHADEADDVIDDIETVLGAAPDLLPALDVTPGGSASAAAALAASFAADDELAAERMRLVIGWNDAAVAGTEQLKLKSQKSKIAVAPILALMQPVPSPAAIAARSLTLRVGDHLDPERLGGWLAGHGFQRCDQVEAPGDFARRGGIVDVFSSSHSDPVRIEFLGDEIESIRLFAAGTQRSAHALQEVQIPSIGGEDRTGDAHESQNKGGKNAVRFEQEGTEEAAERETRRGAAQRRADEAGLKVSAESETTSFLALLPADTIIAFSEPVDIQEIGRTLWQRMGERAGIITADAVFRAANRFDQLYLRRFAESGPRHVVFEVNTLPPFEAKTEEALLGLDELAAESEVVVLCDTPLEAERMRELLAEPAGNAEVRRQNEEETTEGGFQNTKNTIEQEIDGRKRRKTKAISARSGEIATPRTASISETNPRFGIPESNIQDPKSKIENRKSKIAVAVGLIHRGFQWRRTAFVPHHELFRRSRPKRTLRRIAPARPLDNFFDLNPGDYVVHVLHGIGKFLGLKTLEKGTRPTSSAPEGFGGVDEEETFAPRSEEFLAIEFSDQAVVHVPVSQIHFVQKYVGGFRGRPKLSKLGGTLWKKIKERVAEAVTDLAAELLAIQARRATEPGIAYPQDTKWQREFEGSFTYTETEDQLKALGEMKADMSRPQPMDRLLCGDVGFGKTELAMRAAFKAVEYGKQVAVLVPTTVLCEQHEQTFRERMADYPFKIESLSRFRSAAEQKKIVERIRKGQVDIAIGTHRILSADVHFADLGLVVIDEEQRFGVEAKEKLKRLRSMVDVLTLSATPIPRTLHLAMLGIRDISSLATPPLDRRSIVTQVRQWNNELIREALLRELNREGQAYFVHNFVRDIHAIANQIRTIVPEARVVVGHGQMDGSELEDVMLKFMHHEADVLVSTNIIESGIDIPSANTIFINRAERFGLADLHQLRGRVGRSKHRAYCYLLLSPQHAVQETAARRLKAIEQYSALGAGFQIAMRDLEIRGTGNILGAEQSGHIEAVGYEMYCQLLDQAVRRMKNEPADIYRPVNLELGISATIPRAYIRADRQRMDVYKRLTSCRAPAELEQLRQDVRDAFGPPPEAVQTLLMLAEIRVHAGPWGIRSMVRDGPDVVFSIDDLQKVQPLFAEGPGSPRIPDPKTVHWRLPKRLLEPQNLLTVLRDQLGGSKRGPTASAPARA